MSTDRTQRARAAPDPALVPVDERRPEHDIVFAAAYADYLTYVGEDDRAAGTWQEFFASDVSAQLAVVAVEDVDRYRATLTAALRTLQDPEPSTDAAEMIAALGVVFDHLGTLAGRLDAMLRELPVAQPLRSTLGNLVRSRLSPMLRRLIGHYRAGAALDLVDTEATPGADLLVLGRPLLSFGALLEDADELASGEWPAGVGLPDRAAYVTVDPSAYEGAYGESTLTVVERINHLATHNLFTAVHEVFLAVFARVVDEARSALEATYAWNGHQPHYALFLAFLRLLEHARAETNTFSARHLDFYYRDVLRLAKRPARLDHAHVLVELAKHVDSHLLTAGTLLKAGKDAAGRDVHAAVDRDLAANRATVAELRNLQRRADGRILAGPVDSERESWHPFVATAPAEVGFAIASHHLLLAEGRRSIEVRIDTTGTDTTGIDTEAKDLRVDLRCRLTTAEGWLDKDVPTVGLENGTLRFDLDLDGNDPAITPYDPTVHGYAFATSHPVLLVALRHRDDAPWPYDTLSSVRVTAVDLQVTAQGLTSLTLAHDQGPVDPSKPFLAFGSAPLAGSALVIGSAEAFGKAPSEVTLALGLMAAPVAHGTTPTLSVDYLDEGRWVEFPADDVEPAQPIPFPSGPGTPLEVTLSDLPQPPVPGRGSVPGSGQPYSTASRAGFVRLRLSGGFGTQTYPIDLATAIINEQDLPAAPVLPTVGSLTLDYTAGQRIEFPASRGPSPELRTLDRPQPGPTSAAGSGARAAGSGAPASVGRFFHVGPFGHAEPALDGGTSVPLLPRFEAGAATSAGGTASAGATAAEGELYVGVRDLRPPQNLSLLFQVVDGSADPLVVKPPDHLHWSYLRADTWVPFETTAVTDGTSGLLASGIVTLAVPQDATVDHALLPSGLHWIRVAVTSTAEAACRLRTVAAQALRATYVVPEAVPGGPQGAPAGPLRGAPTGTITKPDRPDPAVKRLTQPYPAFGGRPEETDADFAARVSERLRHKDRAIALWDYEHLVLEAFPAVHQVRCLNHTRYEPSTGGSGVYRELAPGHVTVVTIPDLTGPDPHDPLRPSTSLRVLGEIEQFLARRMSCFTTLHVRNPQFEEVRVDLRVRFRAGEDETLSVRRLGEDITRFLSPWAFPGGARPTFGGTLHKSVLVDFVEERAYVDHLADVHLHHRVPGVPGEGPDLEQVTGSRAVAVLVSVPADQHGIHPIRPGAGQPPEDCGCAPRREVGQR